MAWRWHATKSYNDCHKVRHDFSTDEVGRGHIWWASVRNVIPTITWKNNHSIQTWCMYALVGWVFRNDFLLGHIGLILDLWWQKTEMAESGGFWPYLITQFTQNVHTCRVSLQKLFDLGRCWPNFWPSGDQQMTESGSFRPLSGKLLSESTSNLVYGTYWCSLQKLLYLGLRWPNFGLCVGQNMPENGGFRPLSGKFITIHFKRMYTYWVNP